MTSRERVIAALNHREADKIPFDLGGCAVTGMQASTVYRLRQALSLDPPGTPVKVVERIRSSGKSLPTLWTRSASMSPASGEEDDVRL